MTKIIRMQVEYVAEGVSLASGSTTSTGSIEPGKTFHPRRLVINFTSSVSGLIPVVGVTVGTNAACDNIVSSGVSIGAVTAPAHRTVVVEAAGSNVPALTGASGFGTTVNVKVTSSGTGAGAATFILEGYVE